MCICFPNFFLAKKKPLVCKLKIINRVCSKMEEQEDGWLTVLEKNGLGPPAAIFENYGIDSETDLLVLDPDDFSKLASRGLKPLHVKKLERWREAVCEREENMLSNIQGAALISSESLNVVTPAAHSVGAEESECESGAENESERDGEDDDDSDDDFSIRLTMTIRRSLTLTILNYRCSHSLTNEACGSTVSR